MAFDLLATLKLKDDFSGPMGKAERKVGSFSKAASKLTGIVAGIGVGAALGGFAKDVVQTGIGFTESMSQVAAVSGATGAELDALRDKALEMGKSTVFSASEASDALVYLSMAGFNADQAMASLPDTLALAAAGGLELADAADIASNVMSGFNMMAGDVEANMKRVADVMASAASSSNTDVKQLGDAMSYAAPVANAYGISLEESAAAVGIFSNAGIQGSRAGMTLKNTISQLARPVGATAKKLDELGLSAADVNPEVYSLAEIIETLEGAGAKATDAIALVGAEAGPGFAAMLTVGSDELKRYTKDLEGAEGAAQRMADAMTDNLGGDLKELGSVWESFKLSLFFSQEGFLRDIIQGITAFMNKVADATPKVLEFAKRFSLLFKAIGAGLAVFAGLVGAVIGFKLAAMGLSLIFSPIGLVVGAVVALGAAFYLAYQKFEPFNKAIKNGIDRLKELKKAFDVGGFRGLFIEAFGVKTSAELEVFSEGIGKIADVLDTVKAGFENMNNVIEAFKQNGLKGGLLEFFNVKTSEELEQFYDMFGGFLDFIENTKQLAIDKFSEVAERFADYSGQFGDTWESIKNIFAIGAEVVGGIISTLSAFVAPLIRIISNALQIVGDIAMWAFNYVIVPAAELVMSAIGAMWKVVGPVLELFATVLEIVAEAALWLWDNALKPLITYIGGEFKAKMEFGIEIVEKLGGMFEWVGDKVTAVTGWLGSFADKIKNIKLPNWLTNFVGGGSINIAPDGGGGAKATSHYHGLDNVPYDGYVARLHKGERVQTAQEVREQSQGGNRNSVTIGAININSTATNGREMYNEFIAILADELETEVAFS